MRCTEEEGLNGPAEGTKGKCLLTGFLKATLAGGLFFLLPVVLIVIVLNHAMQLGRKVAKPISSLLPEAAIGVCGRDLPRSAAADLALARRWPCCSHQSWQAHHELVRNSFLGGLHNAQ